MTRGVVRGQRSAQHLQGALVHHGHQPHRDRRVLPHATAPCRSRRSRPTRSSTRGSAFRVAPRLGPLADRHQPAARTSRRVSRPARRLKPTNVPSRCDRYGASDEHVRPCVCAAATLVACLLIRAAVGPGARAPIEANLKAVFLFNFSKYVTWPAVAIGERSPAEVRICVTANDAFFGLLKTAVQGEDIDGRPLVRGRARRAGRCQELPDSLCRRLAQRRCEGVARRGAQPPGADRRRRHVDRRPVIAFVRDDNRIRFDINRAAASRQQLNVSSKLLRLARQVKDR